MSEDKSTTSSENQPNSDSTLFTPTTPKIIDPKFIKPGEEKPQGEKVSIQTNYQGTNEDKIVPVEE